MYIISFSEANEVNSKMFSNFVLFFAHFIRIALFLHNSFSNGNVFFPDGNVSLDAGSYAIIRIQAHLQIEHTLNANGVGITSLK